MDDPARPKLSKNNHLFAIFEHSLCIPGTPEQLQITLQQLLHTRPQKQQLIVTPPIRHDPIGPHSTLSSSSTNRTTQPAKRPACASSRPRTFVHRSPRTDTLRPASNGFASATTPDRSSLRHSGVRMTDLVSFPPAAMYPIIVTRTQQTVATDLF